MIAHNTIFANSKSTLPIQHENFLFFKINIDLSFMCSSLKCYTQDILVQNFVNLTSLQMILYFDRYRLLCFNF